MRRARECHESIESARACVERAETVAASATRAIARANLMIARIRYPEPERAKNGGGQHSPRERRDGLG
jgi:hypothetical protein